MKTVIALEELAMFLFGILIFSSLPYAWWWFLVLILVPDISCIGYLANNKVGAIVYNTVHHKAIALACIAIGYYLRNDLWILVGTMLFAHSSMDRTLGYGLKYFAGFKHTHLGDIGKKID